MVSQAGTALVRVSPFSWQSSGSAVPTCAGALSLTCVLPALLFSSLLRLWG